MQSTAPGLRQPGDRSANGNAPTDSKIALQQTVPKVSDRGRGQASEIGRITLPRFTERQLAVAELVRDGFQNKDIAARIGTTEYVIKNYVRLIFDRLGLWNRVELALWYEHHFPS